MSSQDSDLFSSANPSFPPLADRMRPRSLEEYIGQDHILGKGRLLYRAIKADQLSSILLSGPPGTGKTTLARVIANTTKSSFQSLNAVLTGIQDIRQAIEKAKEQKDLYNKRTILFVDEVHRWNKAQQDALLPWVENGTFILIGATTENPWFEVNRALVSRSRVFQLEALSEENLSAILDQALKDPFRGYGKYHINLDDDARLHLVRTANGDARSLLNALELAVESNPSGFPPETNLTIDLACAEDSIQTRAVLYDRDGDYHFDTISAFIKSVRGSDPDAALYWLARMIKAGENPRFIFRRLLISASEDIGLAEPQALSRTEAAAQAFDRVGLPEGQFFLAQATIDLCLCPKSNSTLAYFDALKTIEEEQAEVPDHLKDSNRDGASLGHGKHYKYPHAWKDHWVAQQYLPDTLKGKVFYNPGNLGWEALKTQEILERRMLQIAESEFHGSSKVASVSPENKGLDFFLKRTRSPKDSWMAQLGKDLYENLDLASHHIFRLCGSNISFLLPEAAARVQEGLISCYTRTEELASLKLFFADLNKYRSPEDPEIAFCQNYEAYSQDASLPEPERFLSFRFLEACKDPGSSEASFFKRLRNPALSSKRSRESRWIFAEILQARNPGLSEICSALELPEAQILKIQEAENQQKAYFDYESDYEPFLETKGFEILDRKEFSYSRERILSSDQLTYWFSEQAAAPGPYLQKTLGEEEMLGLKQALSRAFLDRPVSKKMYCHIWICKEKI